MTSLLLKVAYKIYRPVGRIKEKRKKKLMESVLNNGERYDPKICLGADNNHLPRYLFAMNYIDKSQSVIDIACGTGYGTEMLAEKCSYATGIDVSVKAIAYCRKKRKGLNLQFIISDFFAFQPKADVVVCFETVEHIQCESIDMVFHKLDESATNKIIGSFPYKEFPGANKHHYFNNLEENHLNYFNNYYKQIFYQTTDGSIFQEKPKEKQIQNLVFVISK